MKKSQVKETEAKYSVADALFTSTQQRVLGLLFGQPNRSFFLTEIVQIANIGRGGVQRELSRLEITGLVSTTRVGNQKHYQANKDSPLFEELTSIVKKTVGLKQPILDALNPLASDIHLAFIYGSVAKASDTSSSDIDLMIVSDDLALRDVFLALVSVEAELGRKINPNLYNKSEFASKSSNKKGFLWKVLNAPIIELIGLIDKSGKIKRLGENQAT